MFDLELDLVTLTFIFQGHKVICERSSPNNPPDDLYTPQVKARSLYMHYIGRRGKMTKMKKKKEEPPGNSRIPV